MRHLLPLVIAVAIYGVAFLAWRGMQPAHQHIN